MYNIDDIYSYTNVGKKKFTVDYSISFDKNKVPFITVSYINEDGKKTNMFSNSQDLDLVSPHAGYYARKTYTSSYRKGENFIPVYYDPNSKRFSSEYIGHSRHETGELHDDFPVGYLFDKELLNKLDAHSKITELSTELSYLYEKDNLDLQDYNIQFSINENAILSKHADEDMPEEQREYVYRVITEFVNTVLNQQYTESNDYKMNR